MCRVRSSTWQILRYCNAFSTTILHKHIISGDYGVLASFRQQNIFSFSLNLFRKGWFSFWSFSPHHPPGMVQAVLHLFSYISALLVQSDFVNMRYTIILYVVTYSEIVFGFSDVRSLSVIKVFKILCYKELLFTYVIFKQRYYYYCYTTLYSTLFHVVFSIVLCSCSTEKFNCELE